MNYLEKVERYLWKKPQNYQYINNWWDFDIILTPELVFRFPKKEKKLEELKNEKNLLEIVSHYTSFKIPLPQIIENQFFVYTIIKWKTIPKNIKAYNEQIIYDIVRFMKQIHNIPLERIPSYYKQSNMSQEKLNKFVKDIKLNVEKKLFNLIPKKHLKNLLKYIDTLFYEFEPPKKALVHHDLNSDNILIKNNKVNWVIDFSDSRIAWIEVDFCHFCDISDRLLKDFIKKYKWYEDKDFYERVYFLAARSVIFEIYEKDKLTSKDIPYIKNKLKKFNFI